MTVHFTGLLVFAGFVAMFTLAAHPAWGAAAVAAGLAIELLLWSGVFGVGRGSPRSLD